MADGEGKKAEKLDGKVSCGRKMVGIDKTCDNVERGRGLGTEGWWVGLGREGAGGF